jgi:acyl-CoA synthetase (NDP forming)
MKVVSPDIPHKSDQGGVILDINNLEEVKIAFDRISRSAKGKKFQGVVIYPMVRDAREVLIGLSCDPQFGPVVAFGLGGIFTETFKDISLRVAPITRNEALEMIREIRGYSLLTGQRGELSYDIAAVADLLVLFSQLPFCYPEVGEIDLNPVFLFHEG